MTVRYIGSHGDEFAGKSLSFEVVEDINETLRRVDLVVPDEELGFVYYEFKSVKDVPPSHFLEQFSKDLANSKVTDLSQIRWIFDGKKVPADFKSKMLNERRKIKMGNEVLSKFHYANEEELYKAISKKFDGIFIIANE